MAKLELNRLQTYSVVRVSSLSEIMSASCQRLLDSERVDEIYYDLKESLEKKIDPIRAQCLCIAKLPSGTQFLIDGQHRLKAYLRIYEENHNCDLLVCINTIEVETDAGIEQLFKLVNKSVPVAQLPDGITHNNINSVVTVFKTRYPGVFSNSRQSRRPKVCMSDFEECVANLRKHGLSEDDIINKIGTFNKECGKRTWDFFKTYQNDSSSRIDSMLKRTDGFYLGMFPRERWEHQFCPELVVYAALITKRKPIPKRLRDKVWDKYMGANERRGLCMINGCDRMIDITDFHCAHIIADSLGGEPTIDNLYPCCGGCNLSSGVDDQRVSAALASMRTSFSNSILSTPPTQLTQTPTQPTQPQPPAHNEEPSQHEEPQQSVRTQHPVIIKKNGPVKYRDSWLNWMKALKVTTTFKSVNDLYVLYISWMNQNYKTESIVSKSVFGKNIIIGLKRKRGLVRERKSEQNGKLRINIGLID